MHLVVGDGGNYEGPAIYEGHPSGWATTTTRVELHFGKRLSIWTRLGGGLETRWLVWKDNNMWCIYIYVRI